METSILWVLKEQQWKKDSLHSLSNDRELSEEVSSKSQFKLIKMSNSGHAFNADNKVPKHMVMVDEKNLRRCLELVQNSALKAAQCNIPASLSATNAGILSESLTTAKNFGGSQQFVFECPVTTETEGVAISADAGELSGTVIRSKSMKDILNSPLLQKFGVLDRNDNLNRMVFTGAKDLICYDFVDSPKETSLVPGQKYGTSFVDKGLASTSTTNSTFSDWLSLPSPNLSRAMIRCMWEQGVPHFVFSSGDQKEIYVSKLVKLDSKGDKSLDYVYQFYLNKDSPKGNHIPDNGQLVAKMNVSTSFTICPNNCRIMETRFTLFGNMEFYDKQMHETNHSHKKKGLFKISKAFKTSPSLKQTHSMFGGPSAISESFPWESHALGDTNFLDADLPPNFELAAIVTKEHIPCKKLENFGGWGLNFLNKSRISQSKSAAESCSGNTCDCSTSTDIIIPAGFHGGPITRNGGPSNLIDRWKSKGPCDCGGWDEGCPLTVLEIKSREEQVLSQVQDCKTVDVVTQGSRDFNPSLRILNAREDLYFVHFQRPLSELQSFATAMAIIHGQSPTLRPDTVQS